MSCGETRRKETPTWMPFLPQAGDRVTKEKAGSGVMVLTAGAAMVLEEEREMLTRPVDVLGANGEIGHSGRFKGKGCNEGGGGKEREMGEVSEGTEKVRG